MAQKKETRVRASSVKDRRSRPTETLPADLKERRSKPTEALPTKRIAFKKQLDLLRAFSALSGPDGKTVTSKEAVEALSLEPSTVGLAMPFFTGVGFLLRTEMGFLPSQEVISFSRRT